MQKTAPSYQQLEVALQQSEARLRRLSAIVLGVIYQFRLRRDGTVDFPFMAENCLDVLEVESSVLKQSADRLLSMIHPDDRPGFDRSVSESATTLQPWRWEGRFQLPSGRTRWIRAASCPEQQPDGDILWDGLLMDISDRKQAEVALQSSERFHRTLFEQLPVGLALCRMDGTLIDVNSAYANIIGRTIEQTLALTYWDITPKKYAEQEQALLLSLHKFGYYEPYEKEYIHADGHLVPVRLTGVLIEKNGEQLIWSSVEAITERKQLEQELALQQARFNAFFSSANAGLAIMDNQLRHVHINQVLAEVNGLSVAEHVGKTLQEILPDVAATVEPIYQQVINTGKPLLNQEVSGATRLNPEITRYWFSSYFPLFDKVGQTVGAGAVIVDITDRKQAEEALRQKVQEEQLINRLADQIRSSLDIDQILQTVVRSIHDLLQIDGCNFVWYRPYQTPPTWEATHEAKSAGLPSVLGLYPSKLIGSAAEKFLALEILQHDDVCTITDPVWRQLLLHLGFKSTISIPILTNTGDIGVISCTHSATVRPWEENEVVLLKSVANQLAIALNQADLYTQSQLAAETAQAQAQQLEQTLQELQRTQAKLVQNEKMSGLGQLVAGIAHEINNPVNFIHGNLVHAAVYTQDLLRLITLYQQHYPLTNREIQAEVEAIDLDFLMEDLPKLLASMKVGTDRIREIVLALRNFSRTDEAEIKTVNIHDGIDSTLLILQNRLREQHNRPEIQVIKQYGTVPLVECFPGQLNQVFMNILANAIDALEDRDRRRTLQEINQNPSQIHIITNSDAQFVKIRIVDNGAGIPKTVQQRLFDPFFTTKPVGKGTGLGMSISHQIVTEKHNGSLRCNSTPERGAEFIIEIPLKLSTLRTSR